VEVKLRRLSSYKRIKGIHEYNMENGSVNAIELLILASMLLLSATIAASSASVAENQQAPDFTLTSIDGKSITLSDYRGTVVLLDFWATWCGPCRMEIPELSTLYATYKDQGLVIISIDLQEKPSDVGTFAEQNGMVWMVVVDQDGAVADKYGIQYIPTLILIDTEGKISWMHIGLTNESVLASEVEKVPMTRTYKLQSNVEVILSPNMTTLGASMVINGSITPSRPGVEVILEYRIKDGTWNAIATIRTDSASFFTYAWNDTPKVSGFYEVRASWAGDGEYNGSEKVVSLLIDKLPSAISVEISQQAMLLGQVIRIQGALQPALPNVVVRIAYKRPDGTSINRVSISSATGFYNDSLVPDIVGSWALKASWDGDSNYAGAETNNISFVVNKDPTAITIALTKVAIDQGQSMEVSGSISPALSGVQVTLTYTRPDGSTVKRSSTTSADGGFGDAYTPDGVGQWSLEASWPGNNNYTEAFSNSINFSVKQPFPLVYIIGIILAVIIVASLLIVRSRKR
jgi:cytochrome c biogenesis protein CcmG/thiol:disulfide interchange protein DsbE